VTLINFNVFVDEIEKIIKVAPNRQIKTLEERKQEVLKKIQEKFISENNASFENEISEESLSQLKKNNGNSTSARKFIQSFTPGLDSSSKRKVESNQSENEGISFQAQSPPRSPGKMKLFEKSGNKNASSKRK
jgi:hypothetical protein